MRIWGISDLHLSFSSNKPMDIFGDNWLEHAQKMAEAWDRLISPADVVLCPGDLSWAMRLSEARLDLEWIHQRPGKKILGRGNHDYWWGSISKVREALPTSCIALQNDAVDLGEVIVAGSRCWAGPGSLDYTEQDAQIYQRELLRLEMSLKAAKALRHPGQVLIASIHYPPFTASGAPSPITELLEQYEANICVFGHLHGERSHQTARQGTVNGIAYHLIACDFLNFVPRLLWSSGDSF